MNIRKFHICDLLQGPSLLLLVVSGNVRKVPVASLQPPNTLRGYPYTISQVLIGTDDSRTCTEAVRTLCGLQTAVIWILITPRIHKPFTENSSSLIFLWHPDGHITSVADATRILRMVRMCSRMKNTIRKSLTIFHIW